MTIWQPKKVPPNCERVLGYSIPAGDSFIVLSYEGVHTIKLAEVLAVSHDFVTDAEKLYSGSLVNYRGRSHSVVGLFGGRPLLEAPQGDRIELNTVDETFSVVHPNGHRHTERYTNFSGDWVQATFSTDGTFIVLGAPYDFDFLVFKRSQITI